MDENWINSFREKLDKHHAWPDLYIFKFIVPAGQAERVKKLFPLNTATEKVSSEGNYVSVTIQAMMHSSDAVVELYIKAAEIEGIVAL
jgi:hypothetical protein